MFVKIGSIWTQMKTTVRKLENFQVIKFGSLQIGCGRDHLNWNQVSQILKEVFTGTKIRIVVFYLENGK